MPFKVELIKGDITKMDVEVIVNAANNKFWMGEGVAGAIKAAGGQSVEDDAMAKGQVMPKLIAARSMPTSSPAVSMTPWLGLDTT